MATTSSSATKSSGILSKILLSLLAVLFVSIVIAFFIFNYTYSEGNRAGVVIKFSKKGFLFKTYEGEMNLGGMNTITNTAQVNSLWNFSVKDQATADKLMQLEGQKVSLHYREIIKQMPWQGETSYFVDGVEPIE